ncbi:MAG: tetraacyldisaccharide 4'-kinase [Bacteroidaceae bacterium]|nr:tetraacyldisaccharide 4'-kinase [Bacteroidaceae bacterium]
MIGRKRGIPKALLDIINPYAWITGIRNKLFDWEILKSRTYSTPTICIGNITVGGTGKTPHTEYLIRLLMPVFRTAVLSRGYGRNSKGYIKATVATPMQQIGDEPFQIKNKFKGIYVAVCEKRAIGIEKLAGDGVPPEVILLDDAYQHRHVKAGLNILLIDSNRPIWQDCILPFGRMRESLAGISRADIIIITKCKGLTDEQKRWCRGFLKEKKDIPVFFSHVRYREPYALFGEGKECEAAIATGSEVLLVTGIAKPGPLKREIEERGAHVELMQYADHHNFTGSDIADITNKFRTMSNNRVILTTEKDSTRLLQRNDIPEDIKEKIYVIPIGIEIMDGEENMFNQIILDYVTENSRNSRIP